jgi:hypothetical protein
MWAFAQRRSVKYLPLVGCTAVEDIATGVEGSVILNEVVRCFNDFQCLTPPPIAHLGTFV